MPSSSYEIRGITPKGGEDPEKFGNDLKAALKDTAKDLKGSIKRIKVVDDSIRFTIEPTSAAERVIEAIRSSLRVEVKVISSPLDAFADRYGFGQTSAEK